MSLFIRTFAIEKRKKKFNPLKRKDYGTEFKNKTRSYRLH